MRRVNRPGGFLAAAVSDDADDFAIGGIDHVHRFAAERFLPLAIDIHLLDFGGHDRHVRKPPSLYTGFMASNGFLQVEQ